MWREEKGECTRGEGNGFVFVSVCVVESVVRVKKNGSYRLSEVCVSSESRGSCYNCRHYLLHLPSVAARVIPVIRRLVVCVLLGVLASPASLFDLCLLCVATCCCVTQEAAIIQHLLVRVLLSVLPNLLSVVSHVLPNPAVTVLRSVAI